MPNAPTGPIIDRFMRHVRKTPDCWFWTGSTTRDGYGIFGIGSRRDGSRRNVTAHRWHFEWTNGPMSPGREIDHLCRNRACVRPDHMDAVSHAENMARGDLSNNGAHQRAKTHCPYGHEYSPENTNVFRRMRKCRTCDRLLHQAKRRGVPFSTYVM